MLIDVRLVSITKDAKKSASMTYSFDLGFEDLFIKKYNNANIVEAFKRHDSDVYITNNTAVRLGDGVTVQSLCRDYVKELLTSIYEENLTKLRQEEQKDPIAFNKVYKPLSVIQREMDIYFRSDMFSDQFKKSLNRLDIRPLRTLNRFVRYRNDNDAGFGLGQGLDTFTYQTNDKVTSIIPVNNPARELVTKKDRAIVNRVMDAFFTLENKETFMWYLGASLMNVPIYNENVSRLMFITSSFAGSGKSTLMRVFSEHVVGGDYIDQVSSLESYFTRNDRFGAGSLPIDNRLIYFQESSWRGTTAKIGPADFTDLNESELKSLITDGRFVREEKYGERSSDKASALMVVLTNHVPEPVGQMRDLTRRLLPCQMLGNPMHEKLTQMGFLSGKDFEQYMIDNRESFIKVFAHEFLNDRGRYVGYVYQPQDMLDNIQREQDSMGGVIHATLNDARRVIERSYLQTTGQSLDLTRFIRLLEQAHRGDTQEGVWVDDDMIYVNMSKSFLGEIDAQLEDARRYIVAYFNHGATVKKFGHRVVSVSRQFLVHKEDTLVDERQVEPVVEVSDMNTSIVNTMDDTSVSDLLLSPWWELKLGKTYTQFLEDVKVAIQSGHRDLDVVNYLGEKALYVSDTYRIDGKTDFQSSLVKHLSPYLKRGDRNDDGIDGYILVLGDPLLKRHDKHLYDIPLVRPSHGDLAGDDDVKYFEEYGRLMMYRTERKT